MYEARGVTGGGTSYWCGEPTAYDKERQRRQFGRMVKEGDSRNRTGAKFVQGSHRTGSRRPCAPGVALGVREVARYMGSRMCH